MSIESVARTLREERLEYGSEAVPSSFQGVTKEKIGRVLAYIERESDDMVDAVFALLDDETASFYSNPPYNSKFCHGATTAHIGTHIGILQRGGSSKLDREGRDYWIKPLRELGAIEPVYLDPKTREFVEGHPVPKSPNSGYRLAADFLEILQVPDLKWQQTLDKWISEENIRERARLQAEAQRLSVEDIDSGHKRLITACEQIYAPNFLSGYRILFVDLEDGQRISPEEELSLGEAGISFDLSDAMPDLLLWNPEEDLLWVIEAVTSDGEVDEHKVNQLLRLAKRSNKAGIGFTTAYETWKDAARRQGKFKNIAPNTYIWIKEDPAKHFHVQDMHEELEFRGLNDSADHV